MLQILLIYLLIGCIIEIIIIVSQLKTIKQLAKDNNLHSCYDGDLKKFSFVDMQTIIFWPYSLIRIIYCCMQIIIFQIFSKNRIKFNQYFNEMRSEVGNFNNKK